MGALKLARPCVQDGLIEGRIACHQHGQAHLMEDGHDAGTRLADSHAPADLIEPDVMS